MGCIRMSAKNLWIMCGIPGSGKSTWCSKAAKKPGAIRVSRDVIRFNMLEEDEDYFAHEFDVFREFIKQINEGLVDEKVEDIFVDATHLNEKSRNKVLDRLINLDGVAINVVNFLIDFDLAWERNNLREGLAVVPYGTLCSMNKAFNPARKGEKYNYNNIININVTKDGDEIV